ncbi:MAG: hypothetical protein INR71_05925, partial [Terriglobus roseus]|nr:hypothetical protein [Terriglobus roseus]
IVVELLLRSPLAPIASYRKFALAIHAATRATANPDAFLSLPLSLAIYHSPAAETQGAQASSSSRLPFGFTRRRKGLLGRFLVHLGSLILGTKQALAGFVQKNRPIRPVVQRASSITHPPKASARV